MNREARTAEVVFSTEEPIEDFPGYVQVLSHDAAAVDLGRLNAGAAVLVNHAHDDHVGVVERAELSDDRKGRATLRFGESARAQEVWADVANGIRRHISVGANIRAAELDEAASTDDRRVIRITQWEPVEISLASVPADPGAGIGRSATEHKVTVMEPDNTAQLSQAKSQGTTDALKATAEIIAIGEEFGIMERCREAITMGKISDTEIMALRKEGMDSYFAKKQEEIERAATQAPATHLDLTEKEKQRFSVSRALLSVLEQNPKLAPFELECSQEISRTLDRSPNGIFIPHDVLTRNYDRKRVNELRRAMGTGTTGAGEELVGTLHDWTNFIEQLRVNVVSMSMGATMLPGLRQNLEIPEKTSGATFTWLAEGGNASLTDLGTGNIDLTPKTVAGGVQATRRLLKQSLPAVDDLITQDLAEGAAEAIDLAIMEGTGTANQPTGIVNRTGVGTVLIATPGSPTWAEAVAFETTVNAANALRGSLGFVTTAAVFGSGKVTEKSSGSGRYVIEAEAGSMFGPQGTMNGYRIMTSEALTANRIIFGNWAEILIGMWGVLDLRPDPYTEAAQDALIIRAFQDMDTNLRHPVSFAIDTVV